MALKEVGTLAEIGAQVGDVVEYVLDGGRYTVREGEGLQSRYGDLIEYGHFWGNADDFRIISRASDVKNGSAYNSERLYDTPPPEQGPVQLRKVIVPGLYGKVEICEDDIYNGGTGIYINSMFTRADLIAARDVFNALIDAMEE